MSVVSSYVIYTFSALCRESFTQAIKMAQWAKAPDNLGSFPHTYIAEGQN